MTAEEFKNKIIPYSKKLYPMLRRILKNEQETQDALQDLMMKLWHRKKELTKCTNLNSYIVTIARNYSFDLLKKKRPSVFEENKEYKILNIEAYGNEPDIKEKYDQVRKVIDGLPQKYKTVIQMRDIDGFSFEEIQEFTGYEIPHLRVILSRARLKVKEEVEKIYNYEKGNERQIAQQIL